MLGLHLCYTFEFMKPNLLQIYKILHSFFGHRNWWPGDTRFEIIVGAILTQNTNWKNVEKAIQNLKQAKALSYKRMIEIPQSELAELIRPSGYYNQKAIKLKAFVDFLQKEYQGSIAKMFREDTETLREKLLNIRGVGKETADSILLYAGDHYSFVIDLYTYRILVRHGWIEETTGYDKMQTLFQTNIPKELDLYKDFHAQLVAVGNNYCRKSPKCEECPLQPLLPKGGPLAL